MTDNFPVTTLLALYDPDAIGIRTLASIAANRLGQQVNQIFFKNLFPSNFPYTDNEVELLLRLLKELNTQLLGVSIRSSSLKSGLEIIRRVRQELKEVKIIVGGTHAILSPEECIEWADMVCLGEGEDPFLDLLRGFSEDLSRVKDVPGLWVKSGGHIYKNRMNELIDIDNLPAIDYSGRNKWYKEKINLHFAALFYPNMVTADTARMLKDAGLTHGRAGLQSGSERIRKDLYKRNHSNEKTVELANIFHRVGIRLTFDIIVNNPYETEADLRETLRFYLQIPKPFELNMHSLVYFPKTDLTNMALKDGIIRKEHVEGEADEALRLNHVLLKDKKMIYGYKNNLFWNCLFSLISKPFIPSWLIKGLSKNRFLKAHPEYLLYFAKMANIINIAFIGFGLLKDREIGFKDLLAVLKSFSFASSVNK